LINKVYQDKKGFIWIATENGLNKFDGTKFTIYKHSADDSTSIKNNYVRTVFEDSSGNFWVGCINGLMKYDWATNSFQEIKMYKDGKQVSPHITGIIEARDGDIWVATSGQGLFSMKKGDSYFKTKLENLLNSNYLNLVFQDSKGNLWIGSENNGLNFYSPATKEIKTFTAPNGISSDNISSIAEDKQGNIFVGTLTKGLNKYNVRDKTFKQVLYNGNSQLSVKTLLLTKENILYIGTDGQGLKLYNKDRDIVEDHEVNSAPFDLSKGKVHSILQDKDNNFWLGIFQKGIIFIPGAEKKFDYYGFKSIKNNPIGSSSVMSIYKDRDNITWIGTDNDGIYGINDKDERVAHFDQSASPYSISNIILSIYEDSNNNLWVGSYTKGLAKLNRKTGTCQYIPELLNEKIYCITEDNQKNLLIGTYGSGFYKLNLTDGKIIHFESRKSENDDFSIDELSNDWVNDILFDSEGLIWIAHYKGASCYNPRKNTFINYLNQNTILPKTVVYTLYEDKSGNMWIGTTEGLYVFNKKDQSVKSYTVKDGLPNDVICGIHEDENGNVWISTYLGISKFIPAENRFVNYYIGDGLQGNEFTRGARFADKGGKIYFGGINGVTDFYPKDITDTKKELKVLITDFYLFNHAIRQGDKSGGNDIINTSVLDADRFTLAYNDNTFSIEFSALEYTNPERIVYQYMIEELSPDWTNSYPGMNRVTYTNLNPGTYTFKLRVRDHDNYSEIKTIKIEITPPWYQSVWAYMVYAVLGVLFAYFIAIYIRTRVQHRQDDMRRTHEEQINEAKLQFFINISHEIRTPMTLIINPLEKLLFDNKDPKLQKTYVMIYRNAQRILHLINQLMDIRKLDKGQMRLHFKETDIVGFIEDLMLTFEYPAQRKNIDFSFIHKDEKLNVWIDLNNFDKVLLNILSNAFKYTLDNGSITIELTTGYNESLKGPLKKYFEIVVTDNGIGINKDKIEQIFERFYQINNDLTNSNFGTGIGLHLSRSLIELHHGIIFAENREDTQGTRFIVRVPLGCDHLDIQELENGELYGTPQPLNLSPEPLKIPDEAEEEGGKKVKPKTKYRVLVVEDEDEIREYIKNELASEYKIMESSNGKKALELALTESPDLIISDVMMPEMDGITLARKVKQNININHIPIILLTAKATPENKIEGLDIGADAYISKPFNTEVLKSTIANLIENRERLKNKFSGQQQQEDKIQKIEMKSADEILMRRVMKIVNENLSNADLSVEMLAANVGMSRVHMHRKLKELTNQSARDFIRGIRLKQAATLLSGKKLTISEVAYATGFSNLSHFSNSFKEFYGMSPKEYITAHLTHD
jgi:signal transduction histidine kinase/ligand-binding sensor domain-containing protein/DNA-binding response OmpR family regulator